jgi:hypothetical protein
MRRLTPAFAALAFSLSALTAAGQELDARVTVNHQQVQGTSTSVFETLETALKQFLSERQWTNMQFRPAERISCTFNINIKKYTVAENSFEGTLTVAAQRPVYGSSYTTTTFSTVDNNFNFTYQEYDQLEFQPENISNDLTAMLAYYAYLIIGVDMDTMSPLGGTEYLRAAQSVVSGAQGLQGKGWKAFDDSKNRYAIISDMLDGGMEPFRRMQYSYYREGLDVMAENVERGRAGVTAAMELLKQARENKSMSMLPQIFTEYKRDELVSIYKGKGTSKEKEDVAATLSSINASQNAYWNELKK